MTKKKSSAGILIYQIGQNPFHVNVKKDTRREDYYLLGHYGGPFFEKKDLGTWTIPKGEIEDNENILDAAIRELQEETELQIHQKENMIALNPIKQKSGKIVHAWAYEDKNNIDPQLLKSNSVSLEYPPKSGKIITFPEMDRYEFFNYEDALLKINVAQQSFIKELRQQLILKQLIDAKDL